MDGDDLYSLGFGFQKFRYFLGFIERFEKLKKDNFRSMRAQRTDQIDRDGVLIENTADNHVASCLEGGFQPIRQVLIMADDDCAKHLYKPPSQG